MDRRRDRRAAGWGLTPKAEWLTQVLLNDNVGLRVTSGRRTRRENRRLPGATLNGHTSGREVDLAPPRGFTREAQFLQLERAAAQARRLPGTFTRIHDAGTGIHLHIRWPA